MVYDCFTYCNENEMLYIRLKHLWNYVDKFVIVEANMTHRGVLKDWNFEKVMGEFKWADDKIIYIKANLSIEGLDLNYKGDVYNSSSPYMMLDAQQRNGISLGLSEAGPEDIIMISDLDEIPNHMAMSLTYEISDRFPCFCFAMQSFSYYYNVYHPGFIWRGTVIGRKKNFESAQIWRAMRWHINWESGMGYHFSWIGKENVKNKFTQTAHDEAELYNSDSHIENCFVPDESGWFPDLFKRPNMHLERYDIWSDTHYPEIIKKESDKFSFI